MSHSSDLGLQRTNAGLAPQVATSFGEANFGGKLKALSISDVLEFLRVLNRNGILTLRSGEKDVSVRVKEGKVESVTSSGEEGSLTRFLQREGRISDEQFATMRERRQQGERIGRLLIELGILSPRELWEAMHRLSRAIVLDLFGWEQGEFTFTEGDEILEQGLEVDLPIQDLIADGIRAVPNTRLFAQRLPSDDWVFEAIAPPERKTQIAMEAHERYVLRMIDGTRTLAEITRASEIGKSETLRVVFLLFSVGYLKMKAAPLKARQPDPEEAELLPVIRRYNEMFAFLHRYLAREVGPIGDAVLGRYFEQQKREQPVLLSEIRLGRDGTLEEKLLAKNLVALQNGRRKEHLIDGLNELLYSELLAVRRTLGVSHEGRAVQGLRELGLQPVTRFEPSAGNADRG